MYTMLGGETPFDVTENDTPEVVLKKLNSNKIKLSGGNWDYVSEQAKDLLKQMLNFDSSKRPTAKQGNNYSIAGYTLELYLGASMILTFHVPPLARGHGLCDFDDL